MKSAKKVKLSKRGLQALNDIYIIKEDEMTKYDGNIIIPDAYENYAKKFPCTGDVLSKGAKTKLAINIGDKVSYERMGCARFKWDGQDVCAVREGSLICTGVLHESIN